MARPKLLRKVCCEPGISYFKPAGVRLDVLEESVLAIDEYEALRLKDLEGLDQEQAAARMGISQPTFHRLVSSARRRLADAVVNGKAIRVEGGPYKAAGARGFQCSGCGRLWKPSSGAGRPGECPKRRDLRRITEVRGFAGAGPDE